MYTWGRAGPYLGYSVEAGKNQLIPRRVEALQHERVQQVVCGRLHTLGEMRMSEMELRKLLLYLTTFPACTDQGVVYSFGQNRFGELGLGHDTAVSTPTSIPDLNSIAKLTCGRHHSAALDGTASMIEIYLFKYVTVHSPEDGLLWMWGWGARGQLGQGELKSAFSPIAVEGFK